MVISSIYGLCRNRTPEISYTSLLRLTDRHEYLFSANLNLSLSRASNDYNRNNSYHQKFALVMRYWVMPAIKFVLHSVSAISCDCFNGISYPLCRSIDVIKGDRGSLSERLIAMLVADIAARSRSHPNTVSTVYKHIAADA